MDRKGKIFDIQRWSLHDGPGIRTNVFFKGCPLRCQWCSNPESQEGCMELAFFQDKCIGCKSCITHCPYGGIEEHGILSIKGEICRQNCYGKDSGEGSFFCREECYSGALEVMGREVSTEEILEEVMRDAAIYKSSGGGLTVTGGEPFAQPEFLLDLLQKAKALGLHTTIESCMHAPWEVIEKALPFVDLLFMDMKILEDEKHRLYTGTGNEIIQENMKKAANYAAEHGARCADKQLSIIVRTPVIPGINDSLEEIGAMADWVAKNIPQVLDYQLLPYHRLGRGKYTNIRKPYLLMETAVPEASLMEKLNEEVKRHF